MTLPTGADLGAYLRLDDADLTAEATLLNSLISRGIAILESALTFPILSTPYTYVDQSQSGLQLDGPPRVLMFPVRPIDKTSVVITDRNGLAVDPTTYTIADQQGFIRANYGVVFPTGPYTMTTNIGAQFLWNYAASVEAALSQAVIDIAADLYERRSPGAHQEGAGDSRVTWDISRDMMGRIQQIVSQLKLPVGAV